MCVTRIDAQGEKSGGIFPKTNSKTLTFIQCAPLLLVLKSLVKKVQFSMADYCKQSLKLNIEGRATLVRNAFSESCSVFQDGCEFTPAVLKHKFAKRISHQCGLTLEHKHGMRSPLLWVC